LWSTSVADDAKFSIDLEMFPVEICGGTRSDTIPELFIPLGEVPGVDHDIITLPEKEASLLCHYGGEMPFVLEV
jgi:hypothetical protein